MDTAASYNDKVVRQFAIMIVIWGIVGMLVGVIIAAQLIWPALNFDLPFLTYSRLRPLHTNAVIFAFGGSALFATSYYVVQRTCHVRLAFGKLASFTFWGWQLIILLAAITLPLGITQSKEYAELEWPIDLLIAVVWVAYAIVFFGTVAKRRVKHIYVANWFYGAFIITVAVLHIFNNLSVPVSLTKSYLIYTGVVDAMMQWWYGHNAVGFFLTAGFLGMMYYFVPKQAGTPCLLLPSLEYRALLGPGGRVHLGRPPPPALHRRCRTGRRALGMVMSRLFCWLRAWGGMINGMMTLSGAWDISCATDPILKFPRWSALSFYGMSTFEGPMMSIKTVNALSHYTDWTIGHVHSGALGWVAMMTIGSTYSLLPRLYNRDSMYSTKLIDVHFWTSTIGVVLYAVSMWIAGVTEGLMWRAVNADGTLTYSFVESLKAVEPYHYLRLLGGLIFFSGMVIMAFNVWKTVSDKKPEPIAVLDPA